MQVAAVTVPGLRPTRQRNGKKIEREQGSFAATSFPLDIRRSTPWTTRLLEVRLIDESKGVGDGLRQYGFCCFYVLFGYLQANSSDQVGHLPVQPDEVFVLEEAVDACGLDDSAG